MILLGLDIETTGLDQAKGHRIIEVAASLYDLETERLMGSFVQRINPQRSIDPDAQRVHHIGFEDLAGCPTWPEVAPKLVKVMDKSDLIIAHNGQSFDLPFVANELIRIGERVPNINLLDTMIEGRWATPMGKVPNLGELCFACGIDYDTSKAHSALYDVEVMMKAFFVSYRKGFYKVEVPEMKRVA